MATKTKVTRKQAEQVVAAIVAQYPGWVEEGICPAPTLKEDFDGAPFAAIWEEGPDDWTYLLGGGTSEHDHYTYASLSEEFGVEMSPPVRKPAQFPKGVFVEPMNSCVVGIYID